MENIDMNLKLSKEVNEILSFGREEAVRLGNYAIGTEHLFLGILRQKNNSAVELLKGMGVDLKSLKKNIEDLIKTKSILPADEQDNLYLTKAAERVLKMIFLEAKSLGNENEEINASHLLLAILKDENGKIAHLLADMKIDYNIVRARLTNDEDILPFDQSNLSDDDDDMPEAEGPSSQSRPSSFQAAKSTSETPVLDNFGIDLTKAAEEKRLDPIVGREKEIERLAQVLSRRKKNNPILIGDPGVGKSAIAEGLALRIIQKKVPRVLMGKRVVTLDIASIVAGTKYRGQFEERMKSILNELAKTNSVILFIDEIHTIVGAGGAAGSLDAANMLKPALARGEIQCIGATTLDEYRENIEKDGALERRFQKIIVDPTTPEETIDILNNIKERYETHHNVIYTPEAIKACVYLTQRYISDRCLPDKAIDAMDEAGSRVHINNVNVPSIVLELEAEIDKVHAEKSGAVKAQEFEKAAQLRNEERQLVEKLNVEQEKWHDAESKNKQIVDEEKVAEVVAMMTNVPVQRIAQAEGMRLLKMREELAGKVIGQEAAIDKVVKAIQRNRAGLKDPNRPIGSFIFLGPTGVGKTQLAKILNQYLFDSPDNFIRIDMSEYMEKFTISRLIGSPPGYVGYEEGGLLTEKVRRRPYSVVLLDEIEKAHPDIFHILLQVMDEGSLTDSLGRKVDFKNTILIMTSNIGSRELKEFGQGIGFSTTTKREQTIAENSKGIIEKSLRKFFAPEFLNRVDDIIMFNSLTKENIFEIIDIELKSLFKRILDLGYQIKLTTEAKDFIAEQGYDSQYGARPLKRAIQRYLEDPLAEEIIRSGVQSGDTLEVGMNKVKDDVTIKVVRKKEPKGKKQEISETPKAN